MATDEAKIKEIVDTARSLTSHYFGFHLIDDTECRKICGSSEIAFFMEDLMYINKDRIDTSDMKKVVFLVFHEIGHRFVLPRTTEIMVLAMTVIYSSFNIWFDDFDTDWMEKEDRRMVNRRGHDTVRSKLGIPHYCKTLQNLIDDTALNYYWCLQKNVNKMYPNYFSDTMIKEYNIEDKEDRIKSLWGLHCICNISLAEISRGKPVDIYPSYAKNYLDSRQKKSIEKIINMYIKLIDSDNYMDLEICVDTYKGICVELTRLNTYEFYYGRSKIDVQSIIKKMMEE